MSSFLEANFTTLTRTLVPFIEHESLVINELGKLKSGQL